MFQYETDLNKYVYHYTPYTTALEYILPTSRLRFSPFKNTNDPREVQAWRFGMSTNAETIMPDFFQLQTQINKLLKDNCKILCLTRDNPNIPADEIFGRGYSHSRMWAQYAGNHKGVCLIFDKEKLDKLINDQLSEKGRLFSGPVQYGLQSSESYDAFHLDYDEISMDTLPVVAERHIKKYFRPLFFEKVSDWKEEWEYRWALLSVTNIDYEYVTFEGSLSAIILGVDFPKVYEAIVLQYCNQFKIQAVRIDWYNGKPSILPIYHPNLDDDIQVQPFKVIY